MELHRHPGSPASPVDNIQVLATRLAEGRLSLVFDVAGDLDRLRLPLVDNPQREDGLWRRTCLEAFVRSPQEEGYFEFNFAPSGSWAAYGFSGYRALLGNADVPAPTLKSVRSGSHLGLVVRLDLGGCCEILPWGEWQAGISAVIEADDGSISYWALAHPPGKPDFHHPDCFALTLPPPGET